MTLVSSFSEPGTIRTIFRDTDESAANTELTVSAPPRIRSSIFFVTVKYSAKVKQDVTITLKSGAGTAWDTLLQKISIFQETDGVWIPDNEIHIMDDDTIDVVAPAGGSGITSAVAIYSGVDTKK